MLEIVIANLGKVILTSLAALGIGVITIKKYYPKYDIFKVEYIPLYRRGNLLSQKDKTSHQDITALTVYRPEGDIQTSEAPFEFHPSFHFQEHTKAQWQKYQQPDLPWIPITTQTQNHLVAIYRPQPYTFTCLVWLIPGGLLLGILTAITLKWIGNIKKRSKKRNMQPKKTVAIISNVEFPILDNSNVSSHEEADLPPKNFILHNVVITTDRPALHSGDETKNEDTIAVLGGQPDLHSGDEIKDEDSTVVLDGRPHLHSGDETKDEDSAVVLGGQPDLHSGDEIKDEDLTVVLDGRPHLHSGDETKDEDSAVVLGGQPDLHSRDRTKDEDSTVVLGGNVHSDQPDLQSGDETKDEHSNVVLGGQPDLHSGAETKDEDSTVVLGGQPHLHSGDETKEEDSIVVLGGQSDLHGGDETKEEDSTVILGGQPDLHPGDETKDEDSTVVLGGQPALYSGDETKNEETIAVLGGQPGLQIGDETKNEDSNVVLGDKQDLFSLDESNDEQSTLVLGGNVHSDQPDLQSGNETMDEHSTVVLGGNVHSDQPNLKSGDETMDEDSTVVLGGQPDLHGGDETKDEDSTVVLGGQPDLHSGDETKNEETIAVLGGQPGLQIGDETKNEDSNVVLGGKQDLFSLDESKDEQSTLVLGGNVHSDQPDLQSGDETKDEDSNVVLGGQPDLHSGYETKDEHSTLVLGGQPDLHSGAETKDEDSTVVLGGQPHLHSGDETKEEDSNVVLGGQPHLHSGDETKEEDSNVVLGGQQDLHSGAETKDEDSTVVLGGQPHLHSGDETKEEDSNVVLGGQQDLHGGDETKEEDSNVVLGGQPALYSGDETKNEETIAVLGGQPDLQIGDETKNEVSNVVLGGHPDLHTGDETKDEDSNVVLGGQPDLQSEDEAMHEHSNVVLGGNVHSDHPELQSGDETKDEHSTVVLGGHPDLHSEDETNDEVSNVVLGGHPDLQTGDETKDEDSNVVLGGHPDLHIGDETKGEVSNVVLGGKVPLDQLELHSVDETKDEDSFLLLGANVDNLSVQSDALRSRKVEDEQTTPVNPGDLDIQFEQLLISTIQAPNEKTTHVVTGDVIRTQGPNNCELEQDCHSTIKNVQCSNSSSRKKNKRKRRGRKEKSNIFKSSALPSKECQSIKDQKDSHVFHEHTSKNSLQRANHEDKVKLPLENNKETTCRIKSCSNNDSHSIKQQNAKKDRKSNTLSSNISSLPTKENVQKESASKLKSCLSPKEHFGIIKESSNHINTLKAPFVIRSENKDKITTTSSAPLSSKNEKEKKSNLVFDNSIGYATHKNSCTRPNSSATRVNSSESSTNLNEFERCRNGKESTTLENRHLKKKKSKLLFSNSIGYGKQGSDAACNNVPSAVGNTSYVNQPTTVKQSPCTKIQDTPLSNRRGGKQTSEETSPSKSLLAGEFPKWGGNIGGYVFKNTCPIDNWMVIFHHLYKENRSVRERIQREDARLLKELEELYCQGQFNRVKLRIMEVNGIQHFRGLVDFFGNEWKYYLKHLQIFYQNTQVSICSSRYCPVKERRLKSSSCITWINTEASLSDEIQSWFQPEKEATPCGQQFQTVPPRQAPVVVSSQNSSISTRCDGKRTVSARRFKNGPPPVVFLVDIEVYFLMKGNSKSLEEIPETIEIYNARYQLNAVTFLKENEVASHYICIFRSCNNWYLYDGLVNGGKPSAFVQIPAQFRPSTCLYIQK